MLSASSSSPCALSFIFKPCPHPDPIKSGSVGVGCTIDRTVEVTISPSDHTAILFNDQPITFPTVEHVIRSVTNQPVTVSITSPLPLGYGFGISGASALATAEALNTLLALKKTPPELHKLAHTAEIIHKTGLGTVATQITGGFLVKTAPGLPVHARSLPFIGQNLYLTIIDKLETPHILTDTTLLENVNHAADHALDAIQNQPHASLGTILDIAYQFIINSTLPVSPSTQAVIDQIRHDGGHATMAILGQVVISDVPSSLFPSLLVRITDTPIPSS